MSGRNPFRSPAQSPNPTGASAVSSAPSYTTLPLAPVPTGASSSSSPSNPPPSYSAISERDPHSDDEESPEALPELTPRIPSARPPVTGGRPSLPRNDSQNGPPTSAPPPFPPRPSSRATDPPPPSSTPPVPVDILSTESLPETVPPPAYSVTPDVSGGELVVQQGPRRPFQRAPEPFLQFPAPEIRQQEQDQDRLQTPRPRPPRFAPPPGVPNPNPTSERPHSQLSDFAQDFYNAGTATPPPDGQQRQRQQQQPSQPRFAPPPGVPPPPRPRAASTSSGAGSTAPPTSDGRPTTTPTPGHPLLRNGQTLVYPETYYCQKCRSLPRLSRLYTHSPFPMR